MQSIHNQKVSQMLAGSVTIILEALFAFFGGWTLFDAFASWGPWPAGIVGVLSGLVFFQLELYVFIYREYATQAAKLFATRIGEAVSIRANWGIFLVVVCVLMDTFFNLDRMLALQLDNVWAKVFIFLGLEMLILVPFALGKLVHAHINVSDPAAKKQAKLVKMVNDQLYDRMEEMLPSLSASELLRLKSGDISVLQMRIDAVEADRTVREEEQKALSRPKEDPLVNALQGLGQPAKTQQKDQFADFTPATSDPASNNVAQHRQNGHH